MDFDKRLERAVERGHQTKSAKSRKQAEAAMSEADMKNLHTQYRLELSEYIEVCLRKLADHFPGFRFESIVDEDGWGAKVSRDDISGGRRQEVSTRYSRLELLVRPFSQVHIVELIGKGTIFNKELYNRTEFQFLAEADIDSLKERVDLWILEYAEQYAARQ